MVDAMEPSLDNRMGELNSLSGCIGSSRGLLAPGCESLMYAKFMF
jgi:hypothetical protein